MFIREPCDGGRNSIGAGLFWCGIECSGGRRGGHLRDAAPECSSGLLAGLSADLLVGRFIYRLACRTLKIQSQKMNGLRRGNGFWTQERYYRYAESNPFFGYSLYIAYSRCMNGEA